MGDPDNTFLQQHQSLAAQGEQVMQAMRQATDEAGVRLLRMQVARFKGALLVHQRMENEALYPRLMSHPDEHIASAARALYADLGDIYDELSEFERRFESAEIIHNSVLEYLAALRRVMKRLSLRMQREDRELYVLAERANVPCMSVPPQEDLSSVSVAEERERWQRGLRR